jgi:hypothetical protein
LAVGGSLTLAVGAVLFFVALFVTPVAILQTIAGLRVYGGRLRWLWIAVPSALLGIWLGLAMTAGLAAPIAWASVAVNTVGVAAALLAAAAD